MSRTKPPANGNGNGNLTWIYRSVIGSLFLIVIGMIGWEATNVTTGLADLRTQIGHLQTDVAADSGALMSLRGDIGSLDGKQTAADGRASRQTETMNTIRDRLTVLETKFSDHERETLPARR